MKFLIKLLYALVDSISKIHWIFKFEFIAYNEATINGYLDRKHVAYLATLKYEQMCSNTSQVALESENKTPMSH